MRFQKILVAIDNSTLSTSVFEAALEFAKANGSQLQLFQCITADAVTLAPPATGELGMPPRIVSQAYQAQFMQLDQQIQSAQAQLSRFCHLARQQGVQAEFDYRIAEAGQGLCQAAREWRADLMVMGRRGRRGLTEVLLGSVSNYVMHHACCPVLVIQAESTAGAEAQRTAAIVG